MYRKVIRVWNVCYSFLALILVLSLFVDHLKRQNIRVSWGKSIIFSSSLSFFTNNFSPFIGEKKTFATNLVEQTLLYKTVLSVFQNIVQRRIYAGFPNCLQKIIDLPHVG